VNERFVPYRHRRFEPDQRWDTLVEQRQSKKQKRRKKMAVSGNQSARAALGDWGLLADAEFDCGPGLAVSVWVGQMCRLERYGLQAADGLPVLTVVACRGGSLCVRDGWCRGRLTALRQSQDPRVSIPAASGYSKPCVHEAYAWHTWVWRQTRFEKRTRDGGRAHGQVRRLKLTRRRKVETLLLNKAQARTGGLQRMTSGWNGREAQNPVLRRSWLRSSMLGRPYTGSFYDKLFGGQTCDAASCAAPESNR
jgi:hypothetical protein